MKKFVVMSALLVVSATAMSAPPPDLTSALAAWAGPRSLERYQFALVDLNADAAPDAVVHVTDPAFCGNGGCPLVAFRKSAAGYELVASSGMVRKPIYILEEIRDGWRTLAAVVGFGPTAGMVPIRYKVQQQSYRSTPIVEPVIELTSPTTKQVLSFEEVP
jgi:hypothetical protein